MVRIVIVPKDTPMTDLEVFKDLRGQSTFDGREWKNVRGVGDVYSKGYHYVAITEENLMGSEPVDPTNRVEFDWYYPDSYSTTTHETAHALHRYGLSSDDKRLIKEDFEKHQDRTSRDDEGLTDKDGWVDGPRINPEQLAAYKAASPVDRKKMECYASQNDEEYFAQLCNAYLGTNRGKDGATGQNRHNGRTWIMMNESKEMLALLDKLFKRANANHRK